MALSKDATTGAVTITYTSPSASHNFPHIAENCGIISSMFAASKDTCDIADIRLAMCGFV